MTAKEMFEKLGYKPKETSDKYEIRFERYFYPWNSIKIINFDLVQRTYSSIFNGASDDLPTVHIYPELHQAITQQMKELGWIE